MRRDRNRRRRSRVVWLTMVFIAVACTGATGWFASSQVGVSRAATSVQLFDDFDGAAGSPPDSRYWGYATGGGGWGNDEAQRYTDSRANSRLDGQGHLLIEARADGTGYTSARLTSLNRFAFKYGRAEARIKLPSGQGLHPAFWLMGTDIDRVGWPQSGEIDVIETINDASFYHSGLHGPSSDGSAWQVKVEGTRDMSDDFHNYWVERSPNRIRFGIDDAVTGEFTPVDLQPGQEWVFENPAFLLLNLAVGGNWPGGVTPDTVFPATMLVDWVKVTDG